MIKAVFLSENNSSSNVTSLLPNFRKYFFDASKLIKNVFE